MEGMKFGFACDDGVAGHFINESIVEFVTSRKNAKGYKVEIQNEQIVEKYFFFTVTCLTRSTPYLVVPNVRHRQNGVFMHPLENTNTFVGLHIPNKNGGVPSRTKTKIEIKRNVRKNLVKRN